MLRNIALALFTFFCLLMLGCGSGGSGGSGGAALSRPGKALTKVKTSGLLAGGETIGAIKLTLSIPYGVSAALDPATGKPAASVVQLVGAADPSMVFQQASYTAPTPNSRGSLSFLVVNAQGFGPVEYLTVQLDVAPGYFPVAGDFSVTNFAVAGIVNYSETPVSNPTVSVDVN